MLGELRRHMLLVPYGDEAREEVFQVHHGLVDEEVRP